MFSSVVIANRGEIACRVIRACKALGIRALAVYSEADREAPHVQLADAAFLLGPSPAAQSYLDQDRILTAAESLHADAIHPGYGFLSENATFARRCAEHGFVFIGPGPDSIAAMGEKLAARRVARSAGGCGGRASARVNRGEFCRAPRPGPVGVSSLLHT